LSRHGSGTGLMQVISGAGVFNASGKPLYVAHLVSADLSIGTYSIPRGGNDDQSTHAEDEVYVVMSGRATVVAQSGQADVRPGSVIFVPANEEHSFVNVSEDLALVVLFAPPPDS
jgi:mannose-6-phosphate isomerase-like protein (cupin superfamily)